MWALPASTSDYGRAGPILPIATWFLLCYFVTFGTADERGPNSSNPDTVHDC